MDILKYPHKKLRWKRNRKLLMLPANGMDLIWNQLLETMISANGIGLAAPQVGLTYRVFVTSLLHDKIIINPEWEPTPSGFEYIRIEGCLSFPGWLVPIKRFDAIKVKYYNIGGNLVNLILKGLAAQVFQHETEHLSGVLIIDHLTESQGATILRQCRGSK